MFSLPFVFLLAEELETSWGNYQDDVVRWSIMPNI